MSLSRLTPLSAVFHYRRMFAPNAHTVPKSFHGLDQKFSRHQGQAGMSRTTGLNTAVDSSRVHSHLNP